MMEEEQQLFHPDEETVVWPDKVDISQLCRICANSSEYLIPIFDGEGMENELELKIKKHLPIKISKEDPLPMSLCYQCASTLIAWHDLTLGCIEADKRLRDLADFKEERSSQSKMYEGDGLESIRGVSDIEIEFEEEVTTTPSTSAQVEFLDESDTPEKGNKRCVLKPLVKEESEQKQNQVTEDETEGNTSVIESTSDERSPITSKLIQEAQMLGGNYLILPLKIETIKELPDTFTCEYCGESFQNFLQFNRHKKRHKSCSKVSPNSDYDSNVSNTQTCDAKDIILYQCEVCGKRFKLKDSYLSHQRTHTGEKPYVCHVCGKSFVRYKGFKCHLKFVHLGIKDHNCDICGRTFSMKASMEDHRRTHTGERPYVCETCGKSFKSKSSLNIHIKHHTNELPHICTYCHRRFRRSHHLLNHLTVHTGEKNHTCDICGKQFQIKYDMIRHRKLHSGVKPFKCVLCGFMFADKRYLTKHMKSHK